jgi:DNA-binding transcriptional MerR regulator
MDFAYQTPHLNAGLYSTDDAARLLKVHPSRIRRWIDPKEGFLPRTLDPKEHVLTFAELMEINFILLYLNEGVSLGVIKQAAKVASEKFGSLYPLSLKRFDTDGKALFTALLSETTNRKYVEDLSRGQLVFDTVVRPFFRKLEYNYADEPVRFWPTGKRGHVLLDPARKLGKPIDAKSGVPTRVIYDALQAGKGQSPSVVARWLGLTEAAVLAAGKFEQSLTT